MFFTLPCVTRPTRGLPLADHLIAEVVSRASNITAGLQSCNFPIMWNCTRRRALCTSVVIGTPFLGLHLGRLFSFGTNCPRSDPEKWKYLMALRRERRGTFGGRTLKALFTCKHATSPLNSFVTAAKLFNIPVL